ncbi:hypothetical protein CesoFtcFv8_010648 [Champsocephalus esox]|uniref:Uncharacterized protein n=1 Tax=Champsocephalus esox TaxID=159716 RepID=A0AAN8C5R8_9TELE|nr:hypothetical protein CesoFtcFv8_010648 [Champsocephalus esox]
MPSGVKYAKDLHPIQDKLLSYVLDHNRPGAEVMVKEGDVCLTTEDVWSLGRPQCMEANIGNTWLKMVQEAKDMYGFQQTSLACYIPNPYRYALNFSTDAPLWFTEQDRAPVRKRWCIMLMERRGQRFSFGTNEAGELEPEYRVPKKQKTEHEVQFQKSHMCFISEGMLGKVKGELQGIDSDDQHPGYCSPFCDQISSFWFPGRCPAGQGDDAAGPLVGIVSGRTPPLILSPSGMIETNQ